MMRSTHSISVRLCMPTRVSSRISAGRPITWANSRATLKYCPYSSSSALRVALQGGGVAVDERLVHHVGGHAAGLVGVVDALAVERVDGAGGVADHQAGGTRLGPDRAAHRDAPAGRAALRAVGVDLPALGDLAGVGVEQVGGVDALEVAERRQQADADVHGAVADGEDPAVAGQRVAVAVLDVERGLDPRVLRGGATPSSVRMAVP